MQIDSDGNGINLTVNTLNWLAPQSLVSGSAQEGSVDDGLLVGSGSMNINTPVEPMSFGAEHQQPKHRARRPGANATLRLTGDTAFNVTSSLALAGGARVSSPDNSGALNIGSEIAGATLSQTSAATAAIGEIGAGGLTLQVAPNSTISASPTGAEIQFQDGGTFSSSTTLVTNGQQFAINLLEGTFVITDTGLSNTVIGDSVTGSERCFKSRGNGRLRRIEMNGGDVVIDSNNSGSGALTVDTLIFNSNVSSVSSQV